MNEAKGQPARPWWGADFFTAKDFLRHGVLILVVFAIIHLLGLREYTSVLNGTTGNTSMHPDNAALLGIIYVLFYLAATLLTPICFITAGLMSLWHKLRASRRSADDN